MPKRFDSAEFSIKTLQACKQHNWSNLLCNKIMGIIILNVSMTIYFGDWKRDIVNSLILII